MLKHCQSVRLSAKPTFEFLQNISALEEDYAVNNGTSSQGNSQNIRFFIGYKAFIHLTYLCVSWKENLLIEQRRSYFVDSQYCMVQYRICKKSR